MLIEDICLKLYLWPYLSYLANIKGFCPPLYRPGFFPIITLAPGATIGTTIPTFQPTPPTNQPVTPPAITSPTVPSTFLPPNTSPPQTPPPATVPSTPPSTPPTSPPTTATTPGSTTPTCPTSPVICLPGGQSPLPNCPCIDPRNTQKRQVGPIGSDMIVFSPLSNRRKRRFI